MRRSRIMLMVTLVSVAATAAPGTRARADERAIRAALAGWVEAANRGDWSAALRVWAPDLIGWAPTGEDRRYALEAADAQRAAQAAAPPSLHYAVTVDEVLLDGDLAVVRDTWTQTALGAAPAAKAVTFRSFEVWQRQADGAWKISRWIDGPARPATATPPG